MRKIIYCFIIAVFVLNNLNNARAGAPGESFLGLIGVSDITARPSALGGAYGAMGEDINALRYNPAGLNNIHQYEFQFSHYSSFESINYESIMLGVPLQKYKAAAGFAIDFLNYGDMNKRTKYGEDVGTFSADDLLLTFGYSQKLKNDINIGFNLKYFSSKIEDEKTNAMAFDAGALFAIEENITLGFTAQNIGGQLKYISEKEDLPLNFKLSTKYSPMRFNNPPNLLVDVNIPRGDKVNFNVGIELWINEAVAVRGGYKDKVDEGKIVGGIGFRTSVFQLDYAYMWANELDAAHRISAIFRFGGDKDKNIYTSKKQAFDRKFSPRDAYYDPELQSAERSKRTFKFDDDLNEESMFFTPLGTIK